MKALSHPNLSREGFSLIELLLVVALMIVLSTMMYGFGSLHHQKSQKAFCQDNLQKIYIALQIYAKDAGGHLPLVTNALTTEEPFDLLVPRYSADTSLFICPGGRDPALVSGVALQKGKISYAYYMGRSLDDPQATQWPLVSDRQVNTGPKQKGDPIFSETGSAPGNNHHKYGGNILMGDGTVISSEPATPIPLPIPTGVTLLNPKP